MKTKKYVLIAVVPALALALLGVFAGPAQAAGPLIVIDPGHSGTSLTTIDPETQIRDAEYDNGLENQDMWDVSLLLKAKLEAAGYSVLLTKDGPDDTVSKRERVDVANNNGAALAVSLHTSGHIFGEYGEIYVQRMDSYRENINGQRVYFNLPDVADLSQKYGQIFLTERGKIEGSSIVITVNTSWAERGLAPGNIPIVQLFSKVPWLLLEAGVPQNSDDKDRYAQSVFNSIAACIPLDHVSPPIDKTPFRIRYDQTDTNLYYAGTWSPLAVAGSSGPDYLRSDSGASSVIVKFKGSYFAWIATCGTTLGRAFVSLDDGRGETVDLYRTSTNRQQNVWNKTFDSAGEHTVKIWRDPNNRSGAYIGVDAVEVVGPVNSLLPAPETTPRSPTVTALSSATGTTTGGTGVIITGTNLSEASAVTFGDIAATRYKVNSSTEIMAIAPAHAAGPVRVQVTTPFGPSADSTAGSFTYVDAPATTRAEQTSGSLVWTGTWTLGSLTSYSGTSIRYVNVPGASVTASFTGTYLAWIAKTSPSYGIARVTVDGLRVYTVDLYSSSTLYKKKVFDTGILPFGLHWVKIEWTGTKGAPTGGTNINLDAVDVSTSLAAATRTEQSNVTTAHLIWLPSYGTWTTGTSSYYSGGSVKYINKAGSVTVNFTGVRLTLVVKRSTAYGYAKVTVDGTPYSVNLYSATTLYRNKVWSTPFLTPGNHTVKIQWTGTKGASTGGTNINLDAVDVIGTVK